MDLFHVESELVCHWQSFSGVWQVSPFQFRSLLQFSGVEDCPLGSSQFCWSSVLGCAVGVARQHNINVVPPQGVEDALSFPLWPSMAGLLAGPEPFAQRM